MSFDTIEAVEEFYKNYAHHVGFSVRIGSQNVALGQIINKRFLCARQGYKKEKKKDVSDVVDASKKQRKPTK